MKMTERKKVRVRATLTVSLTLDGALGSLSYCREKDEAKEESETRHSHFSRYMVLALREIAIFFSFFLVCCPRKTVMDVALFCQIL